MMYTTIAQTQVQSATPATPPLMEGGILAAIAIYVIKESISFFKHKDANEEKLIATLIEDLRLERSQQLQQMIGVLMQLESSQKEIAVAIQKMSIAISDINLASQQNARIHSEIFAQLRSQERILLSLSEGISNANLIPQS